VILIMILTTNNMSIKTNVQLKADLDANIDTNGNNEITGSVLNAYETDLLYSKVSLIDSEIIQGTKLFSSFPQSAHSAPTDDYEFANKKYVDDQLDGETFWERTGTTLSPTTSGDNIEVKTTTTATTGVIFKDAVPFIHDYHNPTGGGAIPDGYNIFIGEAAGNFTMGATATTGAHSSGNIGIGFNTLTLNTIGYNNISFGRSSLRVNTTGNSNIAIGENSLYSNIDGENNMAIGSNSLFSNTSGLLNTAIGGGSFKLNTTGNQNTAIGASAGKYYGSGTDANTTATKGTYIGYDARASANGQTNEIVIGPDAIANGSNTVTLGDDNVTDVYMSEDAGATVHASSLHLTNLPIYADNAAAVTGGLAADYVYKTSTGEIRIVI
jgi:hypothetical protein